MAAVVVEREVRCSSNAAALWCHISDTERLNRAIGLGKIELSPNDDASAARYVVSTVSGGFAMEYEERPYEWVENEQFKVRRVLRKGLFRSMENAFELEPGENGGTLVRIRIAIEPKLGMLAPIVRMQVKRFLGRIAGELERIDADLRSGKQADFGLRSRRLDPEALERAGARLVERVDEVRKPVAEKLVRFVGTAPDPDVDRMRPFELADRWELDRRLVLATCLDAVVVGLLDLCWDLVCPSCRTASDRLRSLADLSGKGHCQLCDLAFDSDLDRGVEATFRPAAAVRTVDGGPYCIGGPARTPHVAVQAILPPDGRVELRAPARPGKYRVFVRGGASAPLDVATGSAESVELSVSGDALVPEHARVAPRATIGIVQASGPERHVKIERVDWDGAAATAHQVSLLPEFRRTFAAETLRAGISLKVSRVALLFTDLTNSTALYRDLGDAPAFKLVQDHFEILSAEVAKGGGTVVKTIGDAVMAVFEDDRTAFDAAVAMHRAFHDYRVRDAVAEVVRLKIGVFAGPCYAVTANNLLDYFGQTVNVAARLQSAAGAGELVVTEELCQRAESEGWLGDLRVAEHFEARLKGLPPILAVRIAIDPAD